jgi:hypothetical protein
MYKLNLFKTQVTMKLFQSSSSLTILVYNKKVKITFEPGLSKRRAASAALYAARITSALRPVAFLSYLKIR